MMSQTLMKIFALHLWYCEYECEKAMIIMKDEKGSSNEEVNCAKKIVCATVRVRYKQLGHLPFKLTASERLWQYLI